MEATKRSESADTDPDAVAVRVSNQIRVVRVVAAVGRS